MKSKKFLFDTPGWSIPPSIEIKPNNSQQKPQNRKRGKDKRRLKDDEDEEEEGTDPKKSEGEIHPKKKRKRKQKAKDETEPEPEKETMKTKKAEEDPNKIGSKPKEGSNSKAENKANGNELSKSLLSSSLLSGSRFRILNESLYTSTGSEALKLFNSSSSNKNDNCEDDEDDEEEEDDDDDENQNFKIYHQGFRKQTESWPQNPIDILTDEIKNKFRRKDPSSSSSVINIADLGCGEARLAKALCSKPNDSWKKKKKKKKKSFDDDDDDLDGGFRVFSYDLVPDQEGWIIRAECCTLVPLPGSNLDLNHQSSMMDCVVCCLSLMGTDWVGIILESRRILKLNGQLKIAEVSSRFTSKERFIKFIESIGFSLTEQGRPNNYFEIFSFKKVLRKKKSKMKKSNGDDDDDDAEEEEEESLKDWKVFRRGLIDQGPKLLKPCIYKKR